MKGGAGRAVPGDNDAAAVEFVHEFFTDKGICVAAAADGGKYASAINTFKNINGGRCIDSAKSVGKVITNDHTPDKYVSYIGVYDIVKSVSDDSGISEYEEILMTKPGYNLFP